MSYEGKKLCNVPVFGHRARLCSLSSHIGISRLRKVENDSCYRDLSIHLTFRFHYTVLLYHVFDAENGNPMHEERILHRIHRSWKQ